MKKDIKIILARLQERHDSLQNSDNPQVVEVRKKTAAEIEVFKAILAALRGNKTFLNLYKI